MIQIEISKSMYIGTAISGIVTGLPSGASERAADEDAKAM